MESLDYNYYGAAMPPSYQYMSYDANPGLAQPGNIPVRNVDRLRVSFC